MGGGGGVPREGRRKTGHTKYRWRLHDYAGPALPVALALSLALDKETLLVPAMAPTADAHGAPCAAGVTGTSALVLTASRGRAIGTPLTDPEGKAFQ